MNKNLPQWVTILTMILTGLFWLFTINGLPARVTALEETVRVLERKMDKNDIKTDMILDAVKLIQVHILHDDKVVGISPTTGEVL